MPPGTRFAPFHKVRVSRQAATLAALLVIAVPLGCMGLELGADRDAGLLVQEGEVTVQPNQDIEVHFSAPYASVPELVTYLDHKCVVTERSETHFRIRNNGGTARKLAWKASGTAAAPRSPTPWQHGDRIPQGPPVNQAGPAQGTIQEAPPPPVSMGPPR
jgi:hypothetical protein